MTTFDAVSTDFRQHYEDEWLERKGSILSMRVINHFLRKKVKRDDDGYVYDPGEVQAAEKNVNRENKSACFMDFLEDRQKEDAYDDISEFISGRG